MNPDMQLTPTLQRVHELHQAGHTQRAMAEILDREAVPLPPGRSKKWNQPGVRACLQQLAALAARPAPPATPAPAVPTPAEVDPTTPQRSRSAPAPRRRRPLKWKITGPWIQSDSLLWEFLVQAAWDHLTEKTVHTLPIEEALKGLPLTRRRRDPDHLAEALDRLAASRFKAEDELGEKRLLMSIPLLAVILTETALSFQFPETLIKMVRNPQEHLLLRQLFAVKN